MAISLNDHETRIKKLEESGVSTWQKGSNSNGYWAKETTTGLIIQWGFKYIAQDQNATITLPITFSNTNYYVDGNEIRNAKDPNSICLPGSKKVDSFILYCYALSNTKAWFAIGYLISDRILKYIYKAFAIIFTLIFGIRLVSKFTV